MNLPINLGIGGAVQTGYKYALEHGYDVAVQVDGDGQHDPEFLSVMAEHLMDNGLDMVIGSRFIEKEGFQSSKLRRIGIVFFSRLITILTGTKITGSYVRTADDRTECDGTLCIRLSKRLSGAGECGCST